MLSAFKHAAYAVAAVLLVLNIGMVQAQQQPAPTNKQPIPTGSLMGSVYDAETQLPIRFATIKMVPQPKESDLLPIKEQAGISGAPPQQDKPQVQAITGSSDIDGKFRLDGIPSGEYLVAANKPGYVLLGFSLNGILFGSGEHLTSLAAFLPAVHVATDQIASVNLTLKRGAVISGRVLFADGSPDIGAAVSSEPLENPLQLHPDLGHRTTSAFQGSLLSLMPTILDRGPSTDDQGRFRIVGLQPGKYVISTLLTLDNRPAQVSMSDGSLPSVNERGLIEFEMIPVEAPGVFRRGDAKVFEVHGNEQISDADIMIDPSGLHSISGKISAGEDRHAPNGAIVQLHDQAVKDQGRFVGLKEDGTFQFNDLPSGTYELKVIANDLNPITDNAPMVARSYRTMKITVIVGEHNVLLDEIVLTPLKPGEKTNDDDLF